MQSKVKSQRPIRSDFTDFTDFIDLTDRNERRTKSYDTRICQKPSPKLCYEGIYGKAT